MDLVEKFNWIRHNSGLATLLLDIPKPSNDIRDEILKSVDIAVPHRDTDGKGWRSLTLHGHSYIMTDSDDAYEEKGFTLGTKEWTDIAKHFPLTKQWIIKNIPFEKYGRIRIMIVDPGGYVSPHKDFLHGQLLGGINIAITHPKEVVFNIENYGNVEWQEGESRLIDLGSIHQITNNSSKSRIHIIVHSEPIDQWNETIMQLVCNSYNKEYDGTK